MIMSTHSGCNLVSRGVFCAVLGVALAAGGLLPLRAQEDNYSTYYVDSAGGNDGNDGLSPERAWRTLARVVQAPLRPGDSVLLRRGCFWRERLTVEISGVEGHPLHFGAYGDGDSPTISGADLLQDWSKVSRTVWETACPQEPKQVLFDGERGTPEPDDGTPSQAGRWIWRQGRLKVFSRQDPARAFRKPGVEASTRHCVFAWNRSYVNMENLRLVAGVYGLYFGNGSRHCAFRGISGDDNFYDGLMVDGADSENVLFKDCSARGNARHGLHVNDGSNVRVEGGEFCDQTSKDGAGVDMNTVRGGTVSGVKAHGNCYGVKVVNQADKIVVTGCTAWDNELFGIDVDIECRNIEVIANTVYKNRSHGIAVEWKSHDCLVARNRCRDGNRDRASIFVDMCTDVVVAHNIVSGGDNGIQFYQSSVRCAAFNNDVYGAGGVAFGVAGDCRDITLKNNIASNGKTLLSVHVSSTRGFVSDYNDWYGRGKALDWAGKPMDLRAWQATTGQDAHSLAADPMFEDPGKDKFALRAGSPCRDAGVDVGRREDFAGEPVPQGDGVDMGALESPGNQ